MVTLLSEPGALFLIFHLWGLPIVLAGIVNRTIDDGLGDSDTLQKVTYFPTTSNVWQNASCTTICAIQPDISKAFKETYTAATYSPQLDYMSITMKFNGTAIYAFFILANNGGDGITTLTMANFTLDGNNPELFQHFPDETTRDIDYNQLVYSKEDLINAEHTLVISTSNVNTYVYVNFDYAIYTHDDDAPLLPLPLPSSSSTMSSLSTPSSTTHTSQDSSGTSPVAPIVASVIGGVVFLVLVSFLLLFFRRRRDLGRQRLEAEGYILPLMKEMEPRINRQAGILTPFTAQPTPFSFPSKSGNKPGYNKKSSSALNPQMSRLSRGDHEGAYGGDINPNANRPFMSISGSERRYYNRSTRTPLRFVTNGGHLMSSDTSLGVHLTTVTSVNNGDGDERADPNSVETIRRARQNEIDERLRAVQREVTNLISDLRGGRQLSVRRSRADARGNQYSGEEEEMSMEEMREQLRVMREQIEYLREQQRSAWAQGLSDDPPPGYTPTRNSRPTAVPPN